MADDWDNPIFDHVFYIFENQVIFFPPLMHKASYGQLVGKKMFSREEEKWERSDLITKECGSGYPGMDCALAR